MMKIKKMLIAVLAIALLVGGVSAALIQWFGQVKMTATVDQAVLVDGYGYPYVVAETANVVGGESFCSPHYLTSQTSVPVELQFETSFSPTLTSGEITVTYLKPVKYSLSTTAGGVKNVPVKIDVTDDGTHINWTIDFPGEAPYNDPVTEGNGHWAVGLVIAPKGVGEGPAFQIHNNDGTTAEFPVGTWLMSPWGPAITDGWFGWHSGNINTLVTDLDWVSCSGLKHNEDNPDGLFIISIDKSKLKDGLCDTDFYWALNLAIGSGFWGGYMVYEQMACPLATPGPSFNWGTPIVNDAISNYEYATLAEQFTELTLQPYEHLDFYICYKFDPLIEAGIYDIYTTIKP